MIRNPHDYETLLGANDVGSVTHLHSKNQILNGLGKRATTEIAEVSPSCRSRPLRLGSSEVFECVAAQNGIVYLVDLPSRISHLCWIVRLGSAKKFVGSRYAGHDFSGSSD